MTEGGRLAGGDWGPRWMPQYLARGLGGGVDRMIVQDASDGGSAVLRTSIRTFIELFPRPQMVRLSVDDDPAQVYRDGDARWTYVAWASGGTVTVSISVRTPTARVVDIAGDEHTVAAENGLVQVTLRQAPEFNEPLYIVEIPA
jgi:hypothetical protein